MRPTHDQLESLMEETAAFAVEHVRKGGIPFTALVVDGHGSILGRGTNRVRETCDPTAHAEVDAIRDACRTHETPSLSGAILLASGEPCAMCYMNALHAGIGAILYAIDRDEAASYGFDYRATYRLYADDPRHWRSMPASRFQTIAAARPFELFRNRHDQRRA